MAEIDLGFPNYGNGEPITSEVCESVHLDATSLREIRKQERYLRYEVKFNNFLQTEIDISGENFIEKLAELRKNISAVTFVLREDFNLIECRGLLQDIQDKLNGYLSSIGELLKRPLSQEESMMVDYVEVVIQSLGENIERAIGGEESIDFFDNMASEPFSVNAVYRLTLGKAYLLSQDNRSNYFPDMIERLQEGKNNESLTVGMELLYELGTSTRKISNILSNKDYVSILSDSENIRSVLEGLNELFGVGNIDVTSGLFINSGDFLHKLHEEWYIEGLLYLHNGGIKIGYQELVLTQEKLQDFTYLDQLIILNESGISVNYSKFSLEMSYDATFTEVMILLNENDITPRSILEEIFGEKHRSDEYVQSLIFLEKSGVTVTRSTVMGLSLEKGKDLNYVKGVYSFFQRSGRSYGIQSYLEEVDINKTKSEEYETGLQMLIDIGMPMSVQLIKNLSLEDGKNPDYISALVELKGMRENIFKYSTEHYPSSMVMAPGYMASMRKLHEGGIDISGYAITSLDIFRLTDEDYTDAILEWSSQNSNGTPYSFFTDEVYIEMALNDDTILEKAVANIPDAVLDSFDVLKGTQRGRDALLRSAESDPFRALEKLHEFEEDRSLKNFLGKIAQTGVDSIIEIVKSSDVIDRDVALKIAQSVDYLHSFPDLRYAIVEGLSMSEVYDLIYVGREEIFTSSYNGILDIFLKKLKDDQKDIYDVVVIEKDFIGFGIFLEASVSYNRFDDVIGTIQDVEKETDLFSKFIEYMVSNEKLQDAVALSEMLQAVKNPDTLKILEEALIIAYEQGNEHIKIMIQLIGKSYAPLTQNQWFQDIPENFALPNLEKIESSELFDEQGRTFQQYFFYNDEDGMGSYSNFLDQYKGGGWKIEDKGSHVYISKYDRNSGKSIHIYANKPQYDGEQKSKGDGIEDIKSALSELSSPPESVNIVHRGHSYHVHKTLKHIPDNARTVFLGSCGGYQNFGEVLSRASDAHIIATKGVGTRHINDPLFKVINNALISGSDIVWADIWEETHKEVSWNSNWENYIRPDLNFGAIFIAKYNELTKEMESDDQ